MHSSSVFFSNLLNDFWLFSCEIRVNHCSSKKKLKKIFKFLYWSWWFNWRIQICLVVVQLVQVSNFRISIKVLKFPKVSETMKIWHLFQLNQLVNMVPPNEPPSPGPKFEFFNFFEKNEFYKKWVALKFCGVGKLKIKTSKSPEVSYN